jgi:hypothetical protein
MTEVKAKVIEKDGKLLLIDPDAHAMVTAVNKHNCNNTYLFKKDRVEYYYQRIKDKRIDPSTVTIVICNVDEPFGELVADATMPKYNWDEIRSKGETPYAIGFVYKEGIIPMISVYDLESCEKLKSIKDYSVLVSDYGVIEVFALEDIKKEDGRK